MNQFRARLAWYAGVAFSASLLLAAPHGEAAAAHTIARRDTQHETQSTKPAVVRQQPTADSPRRIERDYFQAAAPLYLEQLQTIVEPARASRSLQPASPALRRPLARSPPAHR